MRGSSNMNDLLREKLLIAAEACFEQNPCRRIEQWCDDLRQDKPQDKRSYDDLIKQLDDMSKRAKEMIRRCDQEMRNFKC